MPISILNPTELDKTIPAVNNVSGSEHPTVKSTSEFDKFDWKAALDLTAEQRETLFRILVNYKELFVEKLGIESHTHLEHVADHAIDTADARPVTAWGRKLSESEHTYIAGEIAKYLKLGIVRPSYSSWSSPVVLAPKKDGTLRFCVNA